MPTGRREDGAVLVEFALVLVPLLLLVAGFLQFGLAINAKIEATNVTADGARLAAVQRNPGAPGLTLPDYIRTRGDTPYLRTAKICIEYPMNSSTGTQGRVGDPVKVSFGPLAYSLIPLVGDRVGPGVASIPVNGDATMRLEAVAASTVKACST